MEHEVFLYCENDETSYGLSNLAFLDPQPLLGRAWPLRLEWMRTFGVRHTCPLPSILICSQNCLPLFSVDSYQGIRNFRNKVNETKLERMNDTWWRQQQVTVKLLCSQSLAFFLRTFQLNRNPTILILNANQEPRPISPGSCTTKVI